MKREREKKSWGIYDNFYLIKARAASIVAACGNQNQFKSEFESDSLRAPLVEVIAHQSAPNEKTFNASLWNSRNCDGIISEQNTKLVEKNVEIQTQACWKRSRRREVSRRTNTEIHFSFRDLENRFSSFLPSPSLGCSLSRLRMSKAEKKETRKKNECLRIFQDIEARRVVCAAWEFFELFFFRLQFQFRGEYLVMWLCGVIKLKLFFLNYIIISERETAR